MIQAAIYVRVSTDQQETERQERDLQAFAVSQGYEIVRVYRERASGVKTDRSSRKECIQHAKTGWLEGGKDAQGNLKNVERIRFSAILVTELSRWSRSVPDLLSTLEALSVDGVRLVATNGPDFDIAKPMGRMMITVLGAVAEFERSLIIERVNSGLATAKAKGIKLGRQSGDDITVRRITPKLKEINAYPIKYSLRAKAQILNCSVNTVRKAEALMLLG